MNILAVESSCDETAVAIVKDGREVLCDCIASQVDLHRIYGGVVPEIASRKHIEAIYGLADQALQSANLTREDIDAVIVKPVFDNVFNLIDAIFEGKREACFSLLHTLRSQKADPVELLSLLSGQIIIIYNAKLYLLDGLSRASTASKLGGGYKSEKCTQKAEKIKLENIRGLISLCYESDKNIKQGRIEPWTALELLIAEYNYY